MFCVHGERLSLAWHQRAAAAAKGKTQRRSFSPEHTTRQISISKQLFYDRMLESDGELVDEGEKKSNSNQTERYE